MRRRQRRRPHFVTVDVVLRTRERRAVRALRGLPCCPSRSPTPSSIPLRPYTLRDRAKGAALGLHRERRHGADREDAPLRRDARAHGRSRPTARSSTSRCWRANTDSVGPEPEQDGRLHRPHRSRLSRRRTSSSRSTLDPFDLAVNERRRARSSPRAPGWFADPLCLRLGDSGVRLRVIPTPICRDSSAVDSPSERCSASTSAAWRLHSAGSSKRRSSDTNGSNRVCLGLDRRLGNRAVGIRPSG